LTHHLGVDAWVAGHDYNLAGMNMAIKTSVPYSSETLHGTVENGSSSIIRVAVLQDIHECTLSTLVLPYIYTSDN
jgi:hypothetical protein